MLTYTFFGKNTEPLKFHNHKDLIVHILDTYDDPFNDKAPVSILYEDNALGNEMEDQFVGELFRYMEKELISDDMVLQSAAGYYIGREYYDKEMCGWFPYDRRSGYYKNEDLADKSLKRGVYFRP